MSTNASTNTPAVVLDVHGLGVALPAGAERNWAIRGVSLQVRAGETLCIVGESGSGKSVLASAVMRLLPHGLATAGGRVVLVGESLLDATETRMRALRGESMGMVFQEPMTALNPVKRCGDQVEELLRQHTDWNRAARRAAVLDIFAKVKLPEPERIYRSYPHQLSGGQRQRIVIAMAVILKPKLLICDEPTTALDVTTQKEILKLIAALHAEQGSAVLFITHDMGVVNEIADRVMVMRSGELVESGTREEVMHSPREDYTRKLLACVPTMTPPPPRPAITQAQPALRAVQLEKDYASRGWLGLRNSTRALKGVSIEIRPGETVGVVGESGSGKSTLARCGIRLVDPTGGELFWGADRVDSLGEARLRRLRNAVQMVFQDPNRSLNPRRKVGDSIAEGARNFGASPAQARALAAELICRVRLPQAALDRYPVEFSGGQRQRIAIARALACKPQVLIADEAVSALDVSVQAEIMALLREIQAEEDLALLFITHDLRVAAQLCDRILVMHDGQVVEQGRTVDVYGRPSHAYTQALLAAAPRFQRELASPIQG